MYKSTFTASCPICGRVLFKGSPNSYMEGGCPKCKEYLYITFTNNGFNAAVSISKKDNPSNSKETKVISYNAEEMS